MAETRILHLMSIVALVMFHTRAVATNGHQNQSDNTVSIGEQITQTNFGSQVDNRWWSCELKFSIQLARLMLGCAGVGFNSMALAVLVRKNRGDLRTPFRIVLSSLTAVDLGFGFSSLLLGSLALTVLPHGPKDVVHVPHASTALSTTCGILTAVYHSMLGCGSSTTLALSLDRVVAVFAPIRYRVLSQKRNRMTVTIVPSWIIACLSLMAVLVTWRVYGNEEQLELNATFCWPLLAVKQGFLVMQAVLLLASTLGVVLAHVCTIRKLLRSAILVVPFFGNRTSDTTAKERRQTRRSAVHAAYQAVGHSVVYLPFAVYLLWLTITPNRQAEVCESRFLFLSLLPAINNVVNPLLTLWRLRNCPVCCLAALIRETSQAEATDAMTNQAKLPSDSSKVVETTSTTRKATSFPSHQGTQISQELELEARPDEAVGQNRLRRFDGDVTSSDVSEHQSHFTRYKRESSEQNVKAHQFQSVAESNNSPPRDNSGSDDCRADPVPLKSSGKSGMSSDDDAYLTWQPPRNNYNDDSCRANPGLLRRRRSGSTADTSEQAADGVEEI